MIIVCCCIYSRSCFAFRPSSLSSNNHRCYQHHFVDDDRHHSNHYVDNGSLFAFTRSMTALYGAPRPLHTKFSVEKATPELLNELGVSNWPTWSTDGSAKYKVGIKSPLKVYDCNELSYIFEGDMDIIPKDTGIPVPVQVGDFVTFPDGFECYWYVKEVINKHWYIY